MRFWTIFWSLVAAIHAVFVIANWRVLTAQTELNLLVTRVTAPLGLVMLGSMAALTLLFLVFVVWLETRALVRAGVKRTPDGTESSSQAFADLRTTLERQLGGFQDETAQSLQEVRASVERLEQLVREERRDV